jgi:predicted O-methyltransferase YrrM
MARGNDFIVHSQIEDYLHQLHPQPDPVRDEMEALARRRGFPIIGPLVGQLCATIATMIGAQSVFELGSGFGYSAWWFCTVLPAGGRIVLTEGDQQNCTRAREFLQRAAPRATVDVRCGDGLELLAGERQPFDLVFCDVDKHQYPQALELAHDHLRPGGVLITDNLLWGGAVARQPVDANDRTLAGVLTYNQRAFADPRWSTTIVPLRDGVGLSVKRG